MPSSHLILCPPLLLLSPIPPSIRGFSNESTLCISWPKYWSFSFSIRPSSEYRDWSPVGWSRSSQGQGRPRSGAATSRVPGCHGAGVAERTYLPPSSRRLPGRRMAERSLLHVQGQEGRLWGDTPRPRWGAAAALCWSSHEEVSHVQGKRNPSKMVGVARGHQRAVTLGNHNHGKLANLITGPPPCLTQWN